MKVKNISGQSEVFLGQTIENDSEYILQANELNFWRIDEKVITFIAQGKLIVFDGSQYIANYGTALSYFLDQNIKSVSITSTPPFADPTFRTKRDKTPEIITVAPNTNENIDYLITQERYIHGGGVVYVGAEIGDYVSACIYDKDGVIPAPYRSALCESWPVVASYITGEWIPSGNGRYEINTYPLNAKITTGLYLRINYTACSSGSNRQVGVNYYLVKKL